MHLAGKKITLRSVQPSDTSFVLMCENDSSNWNVSEREKELSESEWKQFMKSAGDFLSDGQLRLVICSHEGRKLGLVDLFGRDKTVASVSLGIVIADAADRGKGYASEAVEILSQHAFHVLGIKTIHALVHDSNITSMKLFARLNFKLEKNSMHLGQPATLFVLPHFSL